MSAVSPRVHRLMTSTCVNETARGGVNDNGQGRGKGGEGRGGGAMEKGACHVQCERVEGGRKG